MRATTESSHPPATPGATSGRRLLYATRRALTPGRVALGLLALAAIYRLALLARGWPALDSDEAVIGLMARHILHGDRPTFFWGQNYMGPFEAYFAALLFALFGSSTFVLGLSALLLDARLPRDGLCPGPRRLRANGGTARARLARHQPADLHPAPAGPDWRLSGVATARRPHPARRLVAAAAAQRAPDKPRWLAPLYRALRGHRLSRRAWPLVGSADRADSAGGGGRAAARTLA